VRIEGTPAGTQRIHLRLTGEYSFQAGQYLTVLHPDGTSIPLSIASAPHRLPDLTLHYRSTPNLAEAVAMDSLLPTGTLTLSAAAGDVICPDPDIALLLVAGGSGVAQAFSCVEQRSAEPHKHPGSTTLVWCADDAEDLYDLDYLTGSGTEVISIVDARRTPENEGMVWLAEHAEDFSAYEIIIAGSPAFVRAVTEVLTQNGISRDQLRADAYSYAPEA
jgi:CDP-4-dehydro-6-deoxyglucose reductase/3-phenylpropionate/trans-cinnamate dioxygenase ferredoxin reductase subunit